MYQQSLQQDERGSEDVEAALKQVAGDLERLGRYFQRILEAVRFCDHSDLMYGSIEAYDAKRNLQRILTGKAAHHDAQTAALNCHPDHLFEQNPQETAESLANALDSLIVNTRSLEGHLSSQDKLEERGPLNDAADDVFAAVGLASIVEDDIIAYSELNPVADEFLSLTPA